MRDFEHDKMYWLQFDEPESLRIDELELLTNKIETNRIKELLWDSYDGETGKGIICHMWYDIYQFLESGTKAYLDYMELESIENIQPFQKDSPNVDNLCIVEIKDTIDLDNDLERVKPLMVRGTRVSVVINKELPTKYRINYLYK